MDTPLLSEYVHPFLPTRRSTRKGVLTGLISFVLAIFIFILIRGLPEPDLWSHHLETTSSYSSPLSYFSSSSSSYPSPAEAERLLPLVLGRLFEKYRPSNDVPPWGNARFDSPRWIWGQPVNETISRLSLDGAETLKMRSAHRNFVRVVKELLPTYIPFRWEKDEKDGGGKTDGILGRSSTNRGIVTIGGGRYFAILLVSLRFLRRAGTTLPVEVFVPEFEYETDICEIVLPTLNAVCRVFPHLEPVLETDDLRVSKLFGFQWKVFSLLFSSFDEVLFLDADVTPIRDVAPLFDSEAFRSTGLVTWPDFWRTTVSPLYYVISDMPDPLPPTELPAPEPRASTESGMLLISKPRHWQTLLMAAYYNFHGPRFYYQLLNQGGTGMGDKETFLPAADVMGLPYYQVRTPVVSVGHRFEDGSTGARVQLQHDLMADYAVTKELERHEREMEEAEGKKSKGGRTSRISLESWTAAYANVQPLFLHLSWPKWDGIILLDHISKWSDMTMGVDGEPEPAFHHPPELAAKIRGTERILWEESRWAICNLQTRLDYWIRMPAAKNMCSRLTNHFEETLDSDVGKSLGLGPDDALYPKLPEAEIPRSDM